VNFDPLTKKL